MATRFIPTQKAKLLKESPQTIEGGIQAGEIVKVVRDDGGSHVVIRSRDSDRSDPSEIIVPREALASYRPGITGLLECR